MATGKVPGPQWMVCVELLFGNLVVQLAELSPN